MSSLNRVQIIGRLGKDPDIRSFNNGGRVANLSIATSEQWKDKQTGEKRERTEWHRVVCFNDGLTGVIERFLKKGDQVYVSGQNETRKFQDQSGQDRYITEVVMRPFNSELVLLGGNQQGQQQQGYQQQTQAPYGQPQGQQGGYAPPQNGGYGGGYGPPPGAPGPGVDDLDDEIPFAPIRDLP